MIAIIGCGFVGLATAHYFKDAEKTLIDCDFEKLNRIELGMHDLLNIHGIKLENVLAYSIKIVPADLYILCLPTPTQEHHHYLSTGLLDQVIDQIRELSDSPIIVRSTVPIGYCDSQCVYHMPEFLTEKAPFNLKIDRVVTTIQHQELNYRAGENVLLVSNQESEMIKLYSNAYLSMRLAFFGDLNRHGEKLGIQVDRVIDGVCMDSRIGEKYNCPPFLISGNCLPKDLKQIHLQSGSKLLSVVNEYSQA